MCVIEQQSGGKTHPCSPCVQHTIALSHGTSHHPVPGCSALPHSSQGRAAHLMVYRRAGSGQRSPGCFRRRPRAWLQVQRPLLMMPVSKSVHPAALGVLARARGREGRTLTIQMTVMKAPCQRRALPPCQGRGSQRVYGTGKAVDPSRTSAATRTKTGEQRQRTREAQEQGEGRSERDAFQPDHPTPGNRRPATRSLSRFRNDRESAPIAHRGEPGGSTIEGKCQGNDTQKASGGIALGSVGDDAGALFFVVDVRTRHMKACVQPKRTADGWGARIEGRDVSERPFAFCAVRR